MRTIFTPERRMIRKYCREDIRISDDYIDKTMRWITARDIEILKLLLKHPFLTIEQIEMMVFTNLKPSSWRNKANERIRRLYHSHCIDRWFPPCSEGAGSSQQHIVLDRAGAIIIAKHLGYDSKEMKWKKRNYIPQTYQHTLKVQDFKAMLYMLNRQLGIIDGNTVGEIIQWKVEHKAKIEYPYPRKQGEREKKGTLIPDALCIYKYTTNERIKIFFLEADNATEDFEQLQSKIRAYVDCYRSGEWKKTEWAKLLGAFPAVVLTFHDEKRMNEVRKYAKSIKCNIRFLFTTYDQLTTSEWKEYGNSRGKTRRVLQNISINVLEAIYKSTGTKEEGLVAL